MSRIIIFIKNIIILICALVSSAVAAPIIDDALLNVARAKGIAVYTACILTPPTTPAQAAACEALYMVYLASLQALNAPFPLVISTTPSPYLLSPYDICRFEPTHFVFSFAGAQPYCPVL